MHDESAKEDVGNQWDEGVSVPDVIADLLIDTTVPGIPAPIRRNFFKAVRQLCSAAIDIPIAHLTGMAEERRAQTAARIKLTNVTANQIAQQMQVDPEYARIAVQKFGQRILRQQVNLDMIGQAAASELRNGVEFSDQAEDTGETINDDWLNTFETEAREKSTEEMQALFGKILAGEIRKPGSFSIRTVRILGSLDQTVASHFVNLCSMCVSNDSRDIRVPSMGGKADSNALQEYGLDFPTLNLLNEHGLIISEYHSSRDLTPCMPIGEGHRALSIPLRFQGKYWALMPKSTSEIGKPLKIHGVALTQSGRELLRIVDIQPIETFSQQLFVFFRKTRVPNDRS